MHLDELLELLSAKDIGDRAKVLSWAESEAPASAALLTAALIDSRAKGPAKVWALIAIARLGPEARDAVGATVLQMLDDTSPSVRRAAISTLASIKDVSARDAIAAMLGDHARDGGAWFEDDCTVSQAAEAAIAKLTSNPRDR